jgi:hypothetical protein
MYRKRKVDARSRPAAGATDGKGLGGAAFLLKFAAVAAMALALFALPQPAGSANKDQPKFKRIPLQFIAALGDPKATSGTNAQAWGLWRVDPGPRGVRLGAFEKLQAAGGVAPAKWQFDNADWWLEENGLIMERPEFPIGPGKYLVSGDREVTAVLTIHPKAPDGTQRWELDKGATLYDVTHLGCRSARYTPATRGEECSPAKAPQNAFRVAPGAAMPPVAGCNKQDYAVLFLLAVAEDNH